MMAPSMSIVFYYHPLPTDAHVPRRGWRACVTDSVLCENVRACAGRVAANNLQACFHDTRALNRAEIV